MNPYYLGDKALSGFARQKIDKNGELTYKGVIHLFGSKVPIYLSLEHYDKYIKGEKVYKILTYLTPIPVENNKSVFKNAVRVASRARFKAIRHVEEIVKKLGVAYEYYESNKETEQQKKCKECKERIKAEWEERLRETVRSNVERQREICKRKVQRLLAGRKRN